MKPKLERTVFLIHWLLFLAFIFAWGLALFGFVTSKGTTLEKIIELLIFDLAHEGFLGILFPMVMWFLPFAFLAGDWIATGKLTMWPWKRKLPPEK